MSQLVFKFPFKVKYYEQDYYVSSNNFSAYRLIESWPNWPDKWLNVFGAPGSGKTHLSKILEKKIPNIKVLNAEEINDKLITTLENFNCIIIDNYKNSRDIEGKWALNYDSLFVGNVVIDGQVHIGYRYTIKDNNQVNPLS